MENQTQQQMDSMLRTMTEIAELHDQPGMPYTPAEAEEMSDLARAQLTEIYCS